MFSGDKWMHCHGAQGICAPNGLFVDWFDEPVSRHHDKYFFRDSRVNQILAQTQHGEEQQFSVYLDKGYYNDTHCFAAHHGLEHNLTAQDMQNNYFMAKMRIAIEWCFGELKSRNPILNRWNLLKVQQMDVAKLVRVAVLMRNAHCCLHGCNATHYFNMNKPSLAEYFS